MRAFLVSIIINDLQTKYNKHHEDCDLHKDNFTINYTLNVPLVLITFNIPIFHMFMTTLL